VVAVFDDTEGLSPPFNDIPLYWGWKTFKTWISKRDPRGLGFNIAIGNPNGRARIKLHNQLIDKGLSPFPVIHPFSLISGNATIGEGIQIMAGAIIQPEVKIGIQCIINTKASIDHECILSDGFEAAPGATLCGAIVVGTNAWICAGATVLSRIKIGADAIIGAGALVLDDVPEGMTVVGVPAKPLKNQK
jgi:sugar O-acyltransferase (sialic acid O-acetyltransferase NeuD family)